MYRGVKAAVVEGYLYLRAVHTYPEGRLLHRHIPKIAGYEIGQKAGRVGDMRDVFNGAERKRTVQMLHLDDIERVEFFLRLRPKLESIHGGRRFLCGEDAPD